jgi:hypothetical protein
MPSGFNGSDGLFGSGNNPAFSIKELIPSILDVPPPPDRTGAHVEGKLLLFAVQRHLRSAISRCKPQKVQNQWVDSRNTSRPLRRCFRRTIFPGAQ